MAPDGRLATLAKENQKHIMFARCRHTACGRLTGLLPSELRISRPVTPDLENTLRRLVHEFGYMV